MLDMNSAFYKLFWKKRLGLFNSFSEIRNQLTIHKKAMHRLAKANPDSPKNMLLLKNHNAIFTQ